GALAGVRAAVHAPDMRIARAVSPGDSGGSVFAQLVSEVARGVFVISENQDLLSAQIAGQQVFETGQLDILGRRDVLDIAPQGAQGVYVAAQIAVQALEIILGGIECGQAGDEDAGVGAGIQLVGARGGNTVTGPRARCCPGPAHLLFAFSRGGVVLLVLA